MGKHINTLLTHYPDCDPTGLGSFYIMLYACLAEKQQIPIHGLTRPELGPPIYQFI